MIAGLFIALTLMGISLMIRKGLDESLWYEANMFVSADGELIIIDTI